ncbi:MAG: hypothetical protein HYR60_20015 [Acidobacteria bacterium]|nr:hypothetical protein [Acidobacteriota bacterium]
MVFRQDFKNTLRQFRLELREFEDRPSVSDSLRAVREAREIMSPLAVWRNDRVHARVRMTTQGYALYNWRTGHRPEISPEQIEKNIHLASKAMVELEAHVPHLIDLLKWEEEFERLFSTLPELSGPDDQVENGGEQTLTAGGPLT